MEKLKELLNNKYQKDISEKIASEVNKSKSKNKKKKTEKLLRQEIINTKTIKAENIIVALIEDLSIRLIDMLPEGYEELVYFEKEQEIYAKLSLKQRKKKMNYTNINLIKHIEFLKPEIIELNKNIGKINDGKLEESLKTTTTKELIRIGDSLTQRGINIIMYENSTQEQERDLVIKLIIIPILLKELIPKANIDTNSTHLINIIIKKIEKISKEWVKYVNYQTFDSKEGKIREILSLKKQNGEKIVFSKEEASYNNKTFKNIKKELKQIKTKITKNKKKAT